MAHTVKIIFGAMALATSLGVAQLAVGGDLGELRGVQGLKSQDLKAQGLKDPERNAQQAAVEINREAKADRAALRPAAPSHTISVRTIDQADSSILLRIPSPSGDARRPPQPSRTPAGRSMIACEPMVSVLTEIAKQLQPGRCVT